jgi:hypothetical protein
VTAVATALAAAALAAGAPLHTASYPAPPALGTGPYTLVQVARGVPKAAGARLVSRELGIWRIPRRGAAAVVARLRAAGSLTSVEPDQRLVSFSHLSQGDPLIPQEWWLHDVGADTAEPPGPGVPMTVVDTGLDMTHPEFAQRPNTIALNQQHVFGREDVHGTAVSSVAAAPANGIGLVGAYPQATLQEWDFGEGLLSDAIAGLDAASKRGRTVINFSAGFFRFSPLLEEAVDRVVQRGSIVVAAAGNDRENNSRPAIPAVLPHVLTVGATNEQDRVAYFSSRSNAMDLAAPGQDIPVAVPTFYNPSGFDLFDGTSFSSPIVAGATAWVWTARPQLKNGQIAQVMRESARDVGHRGWDADTGFGIVDIPTALAAAAPPIDPQEPNDDVFAVRPGGLTRTGHAPLTQPGRPHAELRASMDAGEDPEDLYRVWLPTHRTIVVTARGHANVDLAVWGPQTRTVFERGRALRRDLLGLSEHAGTRADSVAVRSSYARGRYVYVDLFLGQHVARTTYSLSVSTRARR